MTGLLHLWAQDAEDLTVISAAMQDAVIRDADLSWHRQGAIFALMANRFCWEDMHGQDKSESEKEKEKTTPRRIRTGLHIHYVQKVQMKQMKQNAGQVFSLLAILFEPLANAPAGHIRLIFSGGAEIKLTVEALNVVMQDGTASWAASATPRHDMD